LRAQSLFLQENSAHVSAVLYSPCDCANHPPRPGEEFILVRNPNALVSIPEKWLPFGDQYCLAGDSLFITRTPVPL
jgi:hypothetical protein